MNSSNRTPRSRTFQRFALWLLPALTVLLLGGVATAQTGVQAQTPMEPATIKGRIFDEETGETMSYTNVFISGTNIGTMAFTDGFYILRGLRPGTYTVKASYISYAVGSKTVTLGPGEVLNVDFQLEVQAIFAEPFDVAAERALVEVERTGSAHFLSARQMEAMPLDQVVDMVAQQPGVTLQDNEIHIRGGRADDTSFIVDGMSVSDPLAGGGYGYQIDASIINEIEVLTGGFNAEYGQAVSGVVKVSTKEGGDTYEGKASFKRDYLHSSTALPGSGKVVKNDPRDWRDLTNYTESNNIDIVKMSLSGPDPIGSALRKLGIGLPGKQYFLLSGSVDLRDGYLPIYSRQERLKSPMYDEDFWSPRQSNSWNGMAKWTWNINPDNKLNLNVSRQVGISQGFNLPGEGYPRPFMDNLDNYLVFTSENILTQLYYRQVLNETSWWDLALGRNFNRLHSNVNGNDDFLTYDTINLSQDIYSQAFGGADRWHDHYSESWTAKGTYSFMSTERHEFKTGFDFSYTEMQLVDLQTQLGQQRFHPGKLGVKEDIFVAHPLVGAAFFQDTIEYRGLIVNVGLRGDVWAPGKEVEKVMESPDDYLFIYDDMVTEFNENTTGALGRRWKSRISPRLGLSFPFTERDKFFFNYGHFSQWPRFAYVYPQLEAQRASEVQLLGNPNLDPKVTVEYETGIQHEFGGLWSAGLTFFNRDIYDYAKSVSLAQVIIGASATPDTTDTQSVTINPVRYFNGDSARSLGVELSVVKRTTRWLSGSYSLEFQRSTGTNSDADGAYLQAVYGGTSEGDISVGGLTRSPLIWDKPWTTSLNLDFTVMDRQRPIMPIAYPTLSASFPFIGVSTKDWEMPTNWSVNLLARAEAGQRYTQRIYTGYAESDQGDRNAAVGPWKGTVNLRFNKFWRFENGKKVTIYVEARNLFNHKNYRRVNPYTGEGYVVGDYNPVWEDRSEVEVENMYGDLETIRTSTDSEAYAKGVINPSYIENPRIILWGASYQW